MLPQFTFPLLEIDFQGVIRKSRDHVGRFEKRTFKQALSTPKSSLDQ
jgi:hypothetical protein